MLCTIVIILMIELETLTLSPFHHNSDHVTVADEMILGYYEMCSSACL